MKASVRTSHTVSRSGKSIPGSSMVPACRRAIRRSTWNKTLLVTLAFLIALVTTFVRGLDRNSPYAFSEKQMGPYRNESKAPAAQR